MSSQAQKMDPPRDQPALADNHAAPLWIASLDELAEGDGWLLELESPQLYFTLEILDLSVIPRAVRFLDTALTIRLPSKPPYHPSQDELLLGRFGSAKVHLLRDNEDFIRCFLAVGSGEPFTLRLSLDAEGIRALLDALVRVEESLPAEVNQ